MTLLVPLFYLWLAITCVLAALFLLHRLDLRRLRRDEDRLPDSPGVGTGASDQESEQELDQGLESDPDRYTDSGTDGSRPEIDPRGSPSVMDLLDGATLPHDLVPATDGIAEPERHAILISPNSDAEEVGTAFADELTRLGFAVEPDGHDQARATRNDQVLRLKICPDAGTRGSGAYRRYPAAAATDVAIEIWTGEDAPPRLAR